MILSSIKLMIIFNNTSADFVFISADVLLKMITILKELYWGSDNCVQKWKDFSVVFKELCKF